MLSLGSARELCVSTALQRLEPISQTHPSPLPGAKHQRSDPWCLAYGRRAFGQDPCLSIPSTCKVFINQKGLRLVAAALEASLSKQGGTIAFSSFAEQEPFYVCLSVSLPSPSISTSLP